MLNFLKKAIVKALKFIIKEVLSTIIKLILIIGIILFLTNKIGNYYLQSKSVKIQSNTYVKMDFSKKIGENVVSNSFFNTEESTFNFYNLLITLDKIKTDKNISGLYLNLENLSLDKAQIEELGNKILELRENKKKIIAYSTGFNNNSYLLASYCDEIVMPNTMTSSINILGYNSSLNYYKGLYDMLGIKFNVINVGDYKSYGENYTKEKMSEEYRENLTRINDKIFDNFVYTMTYNRGYTQDNYWKNKILDGDLVASEGITGEKIGLIDKVEYENQIINELGTDKIISINDYMSTLVKEKKKDKIALLYLDGEITYKNNLSNFDYDSFIKNIDKISNDDNIKGVVIRINSPGGSALASNLIHHHLKELKSKKTIYISIGGVGASGGYYIASIGNKIYSDTNTITGSIGVVSLVPNIQNLMNKLKVNNESVKKGKYSDLYSFNKDLNEDELEKLYASSLKVYEEFLDIVAENRGINREDLHKNIAQGRVWLGIEAVGNGLVDEIGGLEKTINDLAIELKLEEYEVVELVNKSPYDKFLKKYMSFLNIKNRYTTSLKTNTWFYESLYLFPYEI